MKTRLYFSASALALGLLAGALPASAALFSTPIDQIGTIAASDSQLFLMARGGGDRDRGRGRGRDRDRSRDHSGRGNSDDDNGGRRGGGDDQAGNGNDGNVSGSGRRKPRIPGGSGCDDAGDILEHPECSP